jgi:Uma2 family endonuclease
MIWLVDPISCTVRVYQDRNNAQVLKNEDAISGYDLLPGFSVSVGELFS